MDSTPHYQHYNTMVDPNAYVGLFTAASGGADGGPLPSTSSSTGAADPLPAAAKKKGRVKRKRFCQVENCGKLDKGRGFCKGVRGMKACACDREASSVFIYLHHAQSTTDSTSTAAGRGAGSMAA